MKSPQKTMIIKILDGISVLLVENFREASIRLANVPLIEDNSIYKLLTPTDLAFYITLTSLSSLNRKELRDHILSSS